MSENIASGFFLLLFAGCCVLGCLHAAGIIP